MLQRDGSKVKVFISWSGQTSRQVAEALRDWLPSVLQTVEPYVSSEDIYKGVRWNVDVSKELEQSTYGILCVTADNIGAPWLNFEAGALSKSFDMGFVSPFLLGLNAGELSGPLAQFQSTTCERTDVFKLLKSINAVTKIPLDAIRLNAAFERWWPELHSSIESIEKAASDAKPQRKPSRTAEAMMTELLGLAREHQKALTNLLAPYAPDHSSTRVLAEVPVNYKEVTFLLGRLRGVSNRAARAKTPEPDTMVQMRALVMLLAQTLSPMIDSSTYEAIVRQYDPDGDEPLAFDTVRNAWPEILDAIKPISIVAWQLLSGGALVSLMENELTIALRNEDGGVRMFDRSDSYQALENVFAGTFGVTNIRFKAIPHP